MKRAVPSRHAALPLLLVTVALAACTPSAADTARAIDHAAAREAALQRSLAGLVARPGTQQCLPILRNSQVSAYGPVLVYTVSRGEKYVSRTTGGCEGVERDDILVTESPIGRTCQGDIAHTVDRTSRFPTGSCALGPFVEYRRP